MGVDKLGPTPLSNSQSLSRQATIEYVSSMLEKKRSDVILEKSIQCNSLCVPPLPHAAFMHFDWEFRFERPSGH